MLPRMEMYMEAAFTRRLAYSITLSIKLEDPNRLNPSPLTRWHEATAGKNACDMATSMVCFLEHEDQPEEREITMRLDNCSYKKKNYLFFNSLINLYVWGLYSTCVH